MCLLSSQMTRHYQQRSWQAELTSVVRERITGLAAAGLCTVARGANFAMWLCHNSGISDCRYLVPADLSVGQFVYVIRKRIQLPSEKAIFIFVRNTLPPIGAHYYYSDAWEANAYLRHPAR